MMEDGEQEGVGAVELRNLICEMLSHRGERPNRVLRGGQELWETWIPAVQAAMRYMPAPPLVLDHISSLTVENERLRGALGAIVGGDVPRPVATHWRADARRCKHDKCAHGIAMYEDCSNCTAAFIEAALSPLPATKGEG